MRFSIASHLMLAAAEPATDGAPATSSLVNNASTNSYRIFKVQRQYLFKKRVFVWFALELRASLSNPIRGHLWSQMIVGNGVNSLPPIISFNYIKCNNNQVAKRLTREQWVRMPILSPLRRGSTCLRGALMDLMATASDAMRTAVWWEALRYRTGRSTWYLSRAVGLRFLILYDWVERISLFNKRSKSWEVAGIDKTRLNIAVAKNGLQHMLGTVVSYKVF